MAKTIILGYADERGLTKPKLICGPSVPQAQQIEVLETAKRLHQFPKEMKRLEFCIVSEGEVAIYGGADVAAHLASVEEALQKAAAVKAEAVKAQTAAQQKVAAAFQKVKATAKARNELLGQKHAAEIRLRNAELGNNANPGEQSTLLLSAARKALFGDPEAKVASLAEQVTAAIAAYDEALAEYETLKKETPPATN